MEALLWVGVRREWCSEAGYRRRDGTGLSRKPSILIADDAVLATDLFHEPPAGMWVLLGLSSSCRATLLMC